MNKERRFCNPQAVGLNPTTGSNMPLIEGVNMKLIKGHKIHSDRMTPEMIGYAALFIAIFEDLTPYEAKKSLYRRLGR